MLVRARRIATLMFMLTLVRPLLAQDASTLASAEGRPGQDPRGTGLPPVLSWTFNFDAGVGSFGFLDSLHTKSGLIVCRFLADHPAACAPGVAARNIGFEVDAYADWTINNNFTLSVVGGGADPGEVVRQVSGRTANFALGMLYLTDKY